MEEIIFAGSPFWVKATSTDIGSAVITVRVWEGNRFTFPAGGFTRSFTKASVNAIIAIDVSDVILHQIPDIQFSNSPAVWVEITVVHTVSGGTEAEYTESTTRLAAGGYVRGGVVQSLITTATNTTTNLQELAHGALLQASGTVYSLAGHSKIGTSLSASDETADKFTETALPSGFSTGFLPFVEPSYRFSPWRLRFENRFGALEEVWLAHRSSNTTTTTNDTFTRSNFDFETLTYNVEQAIEQQYNSVAYKTHENNTGWMPEAFNGTLDDILLSNNKWLIDENDVVMPVILEDKSFKKKEVLNETVIQYKFKLRETQPINNVIR